MINGMTDDSIYLNLTPYDFDQSDRGWRALDRNMEYLTAAHVIESYLNANETRLLEQYEVSIQTVHFHAGQEFAMAGAKYYGNAIEHFRQS